MLRRFVRSVCAVLVLSVGLLSASAVGAQAAKADEKAAREAFERGRVYYDSGEFDQAASSFEEAYRLSGRDALLYNLYLAYRDANQQQQAADALRGYLAKVANIENRAQLESRLHALDAGLEREKKAREVQPVVAPVVVAAPEPAPAAPLPPVERKRGTLFWTGIGLAGGGAALMLASIATGLMSKSKSDELEEKCMNRVCPAELEDERDSGKMLAGVTDGLLFGGLAVAATGVVLTVLDVRKGREQKPVAFGCTNTGCMAHATVRF